MRHKSPQDVRHEHLEKMGPELGSIYSGLWNEVAWLHAKWDEYVVLFGTKPSRIKLLNRAAPRFFRIVEVTLFEETLLHIARITDASQTAGKDNLSIRRLPDIISDDSLAEEVAPLVEKALKETAFCRDWRNRRIAHSDLKLALKQGAVPLQAASRAQVKNALSALAAVMNAVSGHYLGSETLFDRGISPDGALDLLYVLQDGLRAARERKARLSSRSYTAKDITPRRL